MNNEATCVLSLIRTNLTKEKINKIINFASENNISISKVLKFDESKIQELFSFSKEDIQEVLKAKDNLGNSSFLLEDITSKGIYLITVLDEEYPKKLKENLSIDELPPMLFCKGNTDLLNEKHISIVGSKNANEISIEFAKNITKKAAKNGQVVVSGYEKTIDKAIIESTINNGGRAIILLSQGILLFQIPNEYYEYYTDGNILILSIYTPNSKWDNNKTIETEKIKFAFGDEIYIADIKHEDEIWNSTVAIKNKTENIFVRQPEDTEDTANLELINKGLKAVNIIGEILEKEKSIEEHIIDILRDRKLKASQIKEELKKKGIEISSQKLTHLIKSIPNIETEKDSAGNRYYLKDSFEQAQIYYENLPLFREVKK